MNVLLLGSTGFSGKEVLTELLRKGHTVTAVTRKAGSIALQDPKLWVLEGNVLDAEFLKEALEDQQAVINCLGIGGKGNGKPNTLLSDTTKLLVALMEERPVKRLIAMSNVGAGDSRSYHPFIFRKFILPYFMKWLQVIIDDKNKMEPMIMKSGLDWTIVRCPNITDKPPKNHVTATLSGKDLKLSITNIDLAQFMVAQLGSDQFLHKTPSVSN